MTLARKKVSLPEKVAMVRETMRPDASVREVARKHGIAPRRLYRWRMMYADVDVEALLGDQDPRVADLRLQVERLEAILGQRAYEIALLEERLGELHRHDDSR